MLSYLLGLAACVLPVRGVVVLPGGVPKPYSGPKGAMHAYDFFQKCAANEPEFLTVSNGSAKLPSAKLLMADRGDGYYDSEEYQGREVLPSTDSFIRGAIQAWSDHLHLIIGPELVWLTILTQLTFYMRTHPAEVRDVYDFDSRPPVSMGEPPDWYLITVSFYGSVMNRFKSEAAYEFLRPYFSTTNDDHLLTTHFILLGFEKTEFVFERPILCGLPSVTLQGTLTDWEDLLHKLDHFHTLGPEVVPYKARLEPVLKRFIATFKEPESEASKEFWNQMVIAEKSDECGAAPLNISGWITSFLFWNVDGTPYARENGSFTLDSYSYPSLNIRTLPSGYAKTPFILRKYGGKARYRGYAISGLLGKRIEAGAPLEYVALLTQKGENGTYDATKHATLMPSTSWALFGEVADNAPVSQWVVEQELEYLASGLNSTVGHGECTQG